MIFALLIAACLSFHETVPEFKITRQTPSNSKEIHLVIDWLDLHTSHLTTYTLKTLKNTYKTHKSTFEPYKSATDIKDNDGDKQLVTIGKNKQFSTMEQKLQNDDEELKTFLKFKILECLNKMGGNL
jgi:hypothetical protein